MRIIGGRNIQDIVDNQEWQALRESMVGTWKKNPKKNVQRLTQYLGDFTDQDSVIRVYNYLTGSAFRMGIIEDPSITRLLSKVKVIHTGFCSL